MLENNANSDSRASPATADAGPTPTEVREFQRLLREKLRLESERNTIEEARADIQAYVRFMRRTGLPEFAHDLAPHMVLMVEQYDKLTRGECDNVLQELPPGSSKSTLLLIYTTFRLMQDPTLTVLAISNTAALAREFNRKRLEIVSTPEWQRLSGARLSPKKQGEEFFVVEIPTGHKDADGNALWRSAGSVYAQGMGGAVVGRRGALCVVDDPVASLEEAMSPDRLAKSKAWFDLEFLSRRLPGSKVVVVTTRWVRHDLAGHIRQRADEGAEHWDILRIPMLSEGEDDPLGRPAGEPLWIQDNPGYWAIHANAQRDPVIWSSMYMQCPIDQAGHFIDAASISAATVKEPPPHRAVNYMMAMDLAYTSGGGDYSVILVAAVDHERNLTIVDGFRDRVHTDVTADRLEALFAKYDPRVIYMDDDVNSRQFLSFLRERSRRTKNGAHNRIWPVAMGGRSKTERAVNVPAFLRRQQLRILDSLPFYAALRFELSEFPNALHDDFVDACGLLTHKPTHLPAPSLEDVASAPARNVYPPEGTPPGCAFYDANGRMWLNFSMGDPADTSRHRGLMERI